MKQNRRAMIAVVAAMTALAVVVGAGFQSSRDLFQKALQMERTEGNLKEAITLFEKVVAQAGEDEALAAQAQLRIGFCYEKLGLREAQKAFQSVIDKYPKQAEAVRTAREKIAGFLVQAPSGPKPGELRLRQIWKGKDLELIGSISPDGKEFLSVDWLKGEVIGRDQVSGKTRVIAANPRLIEPNSDNWPGPKWSKNGRKFVFNRQNDKGYSDLRIFDMDKNSLRVLIDDQTVNITNIFDWTVDGSMILVVVSLNKQPRQWATISTNDGRIAPNKSLNDKMSMVHHAFLSPDGQFVAYDHGYKEDIYNGDIQILSLREKIDIAKVDHIAFDYLLGWASDGGSLIYASDRSGKIDIWASSWDGRTLNPGARIIKQNVGIIEPLGMTEAGDFFYYSMVNPSDVFSTEIDFDKGRFLRPPQKISLRFEGSNGTSEISPNGRYAVYLSLRKPQLSMQIHPLALSMNEADTICLYSFEAETTKNFPVDLRIRKFALQWSPDSRFIFFGTQEPQNKYGVYRLEVESGSVTKISDRYFNVISPDGLFGYGTSRRVQADKKSFIARTDLVKGEEKELYEITKFPFYLSVSPDGKLLSFEDWRKVEEKTIWDIIVLSSESGEGRIFPSLNTPGRRGQFRWSKDSRSLLYMKWIENKSGDSAEYQELWKAPLDGGTPQKVSFPQGELIGYFSFHPESRRLVYTAGPRLFYEIWALENFLPKK